MDFDVDIESDSGSFCSTDQEAQDKYATKYEVISKKCDIIQKENQMLVLRLIKVKKRLHRLRKERKFLVKVLDKYGDNFRTIPLAIPLIDEKENVSEDKSTI